MAGFERFADLSLLLLIITPALWAILGYNEAYIGLVIVLMAISPIIYIYYLVKASVENADIHAYFYSAIYATLSILIGAGLGEISTTMRAAILSEGVVFALTIFLLGLKFSIKIHRVSRVSQLLSKPLILLVLAMGVFAISYVLTRILKLSYYVSSPIVALLMAIIPIVAYFGFYKGKF